MERDNTRELEVLEGGGVGSEALIGEYLATLGGRSTSTVETYGRILRQVTAWLAERPGGTGSFRPELLIQTALEAYLADLQRRGHGPSYRTKVKSAVSGFAGWLIEEKGLLRRNPTRGVEVPSRPLLAQRRLSQDQRYVLKNLVERDGTSRSAATFALGYWAGCQVSDVSWLTVENTYVGPKVGWLRAGHKGGKVRDIVLVNEARREVFGEIRKCMMRESPTGCGHDRLDSLGFLCRAGC